jgi:hypothetical protein
MIYFLKKQDMNLDESDYVSDHRPSVTIKSKLGQALKSIFHFSTKSTSMIAHLLLLKIVENKYVEIIEIVATTASHVRDSPWNAAVRERT